VQAIYQFRRWWKRLFFISAFGIVAITIIYSNTLISELKYEEVKKVEIWAKAYQHIENLKDGCSDIDLFLDIVQNNSTIPMIIFNEKTQEVVNALNIDEGVDTLQLIRNMEKDYPPIQIKGFLDPESGENNQVKIFYTNSSVLYKLKIYPYILFTTLAFFIALAYWAFSASRKSEQSLVWAGMARETAHQIGTPLSSLLGWFELLKIHDVPDETLAEIQKDLNRLQIITERFSKIGAQPGLEPQNIVPVVRNAYQYLRRRSSQKINFEFTCEADEYTINLNKELMSWVIENLIRNSVDSIQGEGEISLHIFDKDQNIYIDITDTGKGIKLANFKTIFEPGFTTKTRGWGLGLSLAKRIVEMYHHGDIYVLKSTVNVGTTIRLILSKAK
jgi:hypothetical protein